MIRTDLRLALAASALLLAAGCASAVPAPRQPDSPPPRPQAQAPVPPTRPAPPPVSGARAPEIQRLPGLDAVIEHDAASLVRRFGDPRLDVREGDMRKLQFAGEACVLDVFLYPLREGAEPVATHVEARRASDGREVDRSSCLRALQR